MKILLATVTNNGKLADGTLRLGGRVGYDFKLFVPRNKRKRARQTIEEANYHWYLPLDKTVLQSNLPPFAYALKHGYDLLVTLPANLDWWLNDLDIEVADFCKRIGQTRLKFSKQPGKRIERLKKGVMVERVA